MEKAHFVENKIFTDKRGTFSPLSLSKLDKNWVQSNISVNPRKYTLRGLHFQKNEYAQAKLIKVIKGHILDFVVDLRTVSEDYNKIFFFDSTGDEAPKEVMKLVERIKEQGFNLKKPIKFDFDSNEGVEHQYGNTECGIYSIFFIVHMLEDKMTEHYIKTHILKDEYMQKFRHIYFNDSL